MNDQVAAGTRAPDDAALLDARDDVQRFDKIAIGMSVAAGVLAAATIVVLVVDLKRKGSRRDQEEVAIGPTSIAVAF